MFIWIIRSMIIIAGPVIGWFQISKDAKGILIGVAVALVVIFVEILIEMIPLDSIVAGGLGAILGLISAKLLDYSIFLMEDAKLDSFMKTYSILIKMVLAYLGFIIAIRKKEELSLLDKDIHLTSKKRQEDLKILDTSAIIDGRILDIIETNFITGVIVVPEFVVSELQTLADSADSTKRQRGRRGLDLLNKIRQNLVVPVKIFEKDYSDITQTDAKILKLAEDLKAKIITTDFNLNKVASVHGVVVLNVNELAGVIKPALLPGEVLNIYLMKEGKEKKQAVAYLEDGTMVVVENGRSHLGKKVEVTVTNVLQTSTGRMIFANLKEEGL
ncbi:MAG: TRAM domain-containing protein [Elusimicrobiota bacterium]|nr:TRAM domain-containing protein [Elusimicrobiota bacterium]